MLTPCAILERKIHPNTFTAGLFPDATGGVYRLVRSSSWFSARFAVGEGRRGRRKNRGTFSHFFSYNLTSDDVNVKDWASSAGSVSSRSHQRHQEMHSTEGWYRYYIV